LSGDYLKLSVEKYGGPVLASWLDRPLGVAGRIIVREGKRLVSKLVEEAEKYLLGRDNLYIDISSSLFRITPEEATRLIRKHGVKKTLFGSDYPMWSYSDELARVSKLLLTEEEFADIYYNNAAKLLKISE
ncbi:MAG: amidohydrolase family protein, partial [Clostridia bacterium]|nr:amidohydrolase family protein [Clostridia bacterium]